MRLTKAVVIGALILSPLAVAAPASADTPGCVSKAEFRKVKKHWAIGRVHRVFDTKGKQTFYTTGYQSREYKTCKNPKYSFVSVTYEKDDGVWRVTSKTALWG